MVEGTIFAVCINHKPLTKTLIDKQDHCSRRQIQQIELIDLHPVYDILKAMITKQLIGYLEQW